MTFAVEPVPLSVDGQLAEYLYRQLNAIQVAVGTNFVAPRVTKLPDRPIIGAIVYLGGQDGDWVDANNQTQTLNGFYGCIENDQGEGVWKRIQSVDLPPQLSP